MMNEWTFPAMIAGAVIVILMFGATKLWKKAMAKNVKIDKEA